LADYIVRLYCPYCLQEFSRHVNAVNEEDARRQTLGATVQCPDELHSFEVEDYNIIGVAAYKPYPTPPYELMPESEVKQKTWLKGALIPEPLPREAEPVPANPQAKRAKPSMYIVKFLRDQPPFRKKGDVTELKAEEAQRLSQLGIVELLEVAEYGKVNLTAMPPIHDGLTTFQWQLKVQSPLYPERTWNVTFRKDIFTKFVEHAKRLASTDIVKGLKYLIDHSPGLTVQQMADVLGTTYFPVYRGLRELLSTGQREEVEREIGELAAEEPEANQTLQLYKQESYSPFLKMGDFERVTQNDTPLFQLEEPPQLIGNVPTYILKRAPPPLPYSPVPYQVQVPTMIWQPVRVIVEGKAKWGSKWVPYVRETDIDEIRRIKLPRLKASLEPYGYDANVRLTEGKLILTITPQPQVRIGPKWHGQNTFYPKTFPTFQKLREDLQAIMTLEHYKPTPEEMLENERQLQKQREAWMKQTLTYYFR